MRCESLRAVVLAFGRIVRSRVVLTGALIALIMCMSRPGFGIQPGGWPEAFFVGIQGGHFDQVSGHCINDNRNESGEYIDHYLYDLRADLQPRGVLPQDSHGHDVYGGMQYAGYGDIWGASFDCSGGYSASFWSDDPDLEVWYGGEYGYEGEVYFFSQYAGQ